MSGKLDHWKRARVLARLILFIEQRENASLRRFPSRLRLFRELSADQELLSMPRLIHQGLRCASK